MGARADTDRTAARLTSAGAGVLASAVLLDSGVEHYRGSFRNPAMLLPLAASGVAIGLDGCRILGRGEAGPLKLRAAGQGGTALVGLMGLGFHLFNLWKRPGRVGPDALFHGAPLGAPLALVLSGALGAIADRLWGPAPSFADGRVPGAVCAAGIMGTVAEASLLHFRGAFQNRAMWLPIALPPFAALSLARDVAASRPRRSTALLLVVTAATGLAGVAFHARGIARRMGGWRNWRQNLLAGPPLPAPPAFTGLAIAALGALLLMRRAYG